MLKNEKQAPKRDSSGQEDFMKTIEEMYRAGIHFGYSRSSRHPKMTRYLFGVRNNADVFDLEKAHSCLEEAKNFLRDLGKKKDKFLLVATKAEAKDFVEKAGRGIGMPYVVERWLGGTLTNFKVIKKRIEDFENLCQKKTSGAFSELRKKEIVQLDKKLIKLEKQIGGLRSLGEMPKAMVIIDPRAENIAVMEAKKVGIPIIAVLSSNCDPTGINYPIPANDSSSTSIQYILDSLLVAYKDGTIKSNE